MRVKLAYGKEGLWVELPDDNVTVLEPRYVPGLPDEREGLRGALRAPTGTPPLRDLVTPDDAVAVVFSDITRPQPRKQMLPVVLEEISRVPREQIVLINAVGTHRANTQDELDEMLGHEIVEGYRIVQHVLVFVSEQLGPRVGALVPDLDRNGRPVPDIALVGQPGDAL